MQGAEDNEQANASAGGAQQGNQPIGNSSTARATGTENEHAVPPVAVAFPAHHFVYPHMPPPSLYDEIRELGREIATLEQGGENALRNADPYEWSRRYGIEETVRAAENRLRQRELESWGIQGAANGGQDPGVENNAQDLADKLGILKLYDDLINIVAPEDENLGEEFDENELDGMPPCARKIFKTAQRVSRCVVLTEGLELDEFLEEQRRMGLLPNDEIIIVDESQREHSTEELSREINNLLRERNGTCNRAPQE